MAKRKPKTLYGTRLEQHIIDHVEAIIEAKGEAHLGLNGGTLSPPHNGHLLVAQSALEKFELDSILWIPNGNPPHKLDALDKELRYEMVEAAIDGNPNFLVTRLECDRPGLSFTNITIRQLRHYLGPKVHFSMIFGADNVQQLADWEGGDEIINNCRLLIAARETCDKNGGANKSIVKRWRSLLPGADLERIDCPMHSISSSEIRRLIQEGRSIEYYVPAKVNALIKERGHYLTKTAAAVA